ncbi:MAG: glycosyltransferase [Deltaproteobacteria bacterium]|nr:glycosyltransferase [Deltaproteobacteria bacterium]
MDEILLVLPSLNQRATNLHELDLGYAHGIISYLVQISRLTVLLPPDIDVREYKNYLNRYFGSHVGVKLITEKDTPRNQFSDARPLYSLPFLDRSTQLYEYLTGLDYGCVIFDVFDAAGFIPIRAKRMGLGLEKTLLVSWLRSCHEFHQRQVLETSRNLWFENHINFAERYCCENCDLVICHTATILDWCLGQKWNINHSSVMMLDGIKPGLPLQCPGNKESVIDSNQNQGTQESKSKPLVSICVAHFNDGNNLIHLLKSIEQSDYENFEVIVVDDGSTDIESLRIIETLESEYASESWRFILKEENESIGPTRNFAVTQARGELIIFMDSDNLATKTMISDFVRGMLKSGVDCLTCGMIQFKGEGGSPDSAIFIGQWLPLGACLELGFTDNVFGDANFCIKKSVFKALGGFCGIRGHVADDWEFLARLVLKGFSLDVIPKGLFLYRVRSGSWLHSAWSRHSIYTLRTKFLAHTGPQHVALLHNLLLQLVAENETFRSFVWKLDRKVVKAALWLSEIVSEETRIFIQEISKRFVDKFINIIVLGINFLKPEVNLFLSIFRVFGRSRLDLQQESSKVAGHGVDGRRSFVAKPTNTELEERFYRWGLPLDRPIFGYCGQLSPVKRPIGFLKLAYWMQMFEDNSFFVIVGEGDLQEEIQATAAKYKLSNFRRIASVENIEEFYPVLSGLVITSTYEQRGPKEMFEALANGIPVFSTDVGETKSVLERYGSGLVVKHDPERKDFADSFKLWKDNLEIYTVAAMDTASLIQRFK